MDPHDSDHPDAAILAGRHLRFGWWALLSFVALGVVLEIMHGFKVGWYLKDAYETRRLMWTLGHAHGTLLALVNVAFAISIAAFSAGYGRCHRWASPCLLGATVLLPGGFFLGGTFTFDGDPGIGIFLVPLGAAMLFIGVLLTAIAVTSHQQPVKPNQTNAKHVKKRPGKGSR